ERALAITLQQTLKKEYIVLYDLLLEQNGSHFQIDCLIISEAQLYLLEVKYLYGDYYFQDNDLYAVKTRKRIKNPFYQNQRCEDLLRDFLLQHQLHYQINSYILFNHPTFTLYQAPLQKNMILPTQVERFVEMLNRQIVRTTSNEQQLQQTIYREHIDENPFEKIPSYDYEGLKKGILCIKCSAWMERASKYHLQCLSCGQREFIDSAVLRSVVEFN